MLPWLLRIFSAHTPDNSFLGFVVLHSTAKATNVTSVVKDNYSLVLGKESQYIAVCDLTV
jgi:Glycosyltransferase family 18